MYAIVEIAGQQFKVEKDQELFVHRLEEKEGSKVNFDNVLMTVDGSKIEVGAPAVKGVSVSAKIVEHLKGDKVIVFKKKRRKGYKVKNGHRQYLSKIQIESIGASKGTAKKAAEPKAEKAEEKKTEAKPKAKKAAPKASTAKKAEPAKKAAPAKKAETAKKAEPAKKEAKPKAEKKPAAKKPAAKKEATKKEDK